MSGIMKIKIGAITKVATSLVGIKTFGVDAANEDVQVPLQLVEDAKNLAIAAKDTAVTKAGEVVVNTGITTTKAAEAAASAAAFPVTHPEIAFNTRVVADSGTINQQLTNRIYAESQAKNASIYLLLSGAYKARTSGLNQFVTKAYDFSPNANDAVNATGTTDPFLDGFIVPKANLGIKYVAGQTQTGILTFGTALTKQATDSWTLRVVLKANRTQGSIIDLGGGILYLNATSIVLINGAVQTLSTNYSLDYGKKNTIEFQYSNGAGLIKVNGLPLATTCVSGAITFNRILRSSSPAFDGTLYHLALYPYRCSEAESVKETAFLKSILPDAETVVINGYEITTQNAENIVTPDGTVVNNVTGNTTNGNAELITNHTFDTSIGWSPSGESTISGGVARVYSSAGVASQILSTEAILTIGKLYRFTYDITAHSGSYITIQQGSGVLSDFNIGVGKIFYFIATDTSLVLKRGGITDTSFDNIYCKEVGWDSSTLIYDATYAATSGSVNVKTLEAQKAAAAYCLYNNDPLLGAIYGKLYNWYAAVLLAPKGWHLLSSAEWTQIITALGGSTVAGGKLKALFGGFNNAFASNESGVSLTPSGRRIQDGNFIPTETTISLQNNSGATYSVYVLGAVDTQIIYNSGYPKQRGCSLRYARNTPSGDQSRTIETDYLTTNFATGTNVDVVIPWGYKVVDVIADSETGITAFQAQLLNAAGSLQATLCTGKTVVAGTLADFSTAQVDQVKTYTDNIVRLNGTKAGTADRMRFSIKLEKQL